MGTGIYPDGSDKIHVVKWVDDAHKRNIMNQYPHKWVGTHRRKTRRYRTHYPARVELRRMHNGVNLLLKVMDNSVEMSMNGTLHVLNIKFFDEMTEAVKIARISLQRQNI